MALGNDQPTVDTRGLQLYRNRDFTILWCGQAASDFGSAMSLLVFPLIGYAISNSVIQAGFAAAAMLLGQVLVGLPAGALVDRWSRSLVLVIGNLAGFVVFSSLAIATFADALTMPHLVFGGFASGVISSFLDPASSAAIRTVVPAEQLPQAYTRLEARQHAVDLTGAPLGGALFSVARGIPFLIDAVSYCVMALAITRLRSALPAPETATGRSFGRELAEGLRFVWHNVGIRILTIWGAIFNFAVTVVFVGVTLRLVRAGVDPAAIGAVYAAAAAAGLLGAMLAPFVIRRIPTGILTIATTLVIAVIITPMAWTQNMVIIGALLAVGMFLLPANNAGVSAYMAAATPASFQGRMVSASRFVTSLASPVAPVAAGWLIGSVGGRTATLAGAVLVGLSAVPLVASPVARSLGCPDTWSPRATESP